jgi:hypothetical protein
MQCVRIVSLVAFTLTPALALAWGSSAPFAATVHHHEFSRVEASGDGCVARARLTYIAPEQAYGSPEQERNSYSFKARVRFASGKRMFSVPFTNTAPGKRVYRFRVDTGKHGCWARAEQKVVGVDVEGCRGQGCRVRPFQQ